MRTLVNDTKEHGFSFIALLIILAVVGVLVFVGYSVYNRQNTTADNTDAATTAPAATKAKDTPPAPQINSTSDLDKASATLDQTDTSSSADATALDSQLQSF